MQIARQEHSSSDIQKPHYVLRRFHPNLSRLPFIINRLNVCPRLYRGVDCSTYRPPKLLLYGQRTAHTNRRPSVHSAAKITNWHKRRGVIYAQLRFVPVEIAIDPGVVKSSDGLQGVFSIHVPDRVKTAPQMEHVYTFPDFSH